MRAGVTAVVLCVLMAGTAAAEPQPPFGHAGRFITDSTGRVFTTHGVNMVFKVAPYEPSVAGFGDDDAAFLRISR